MIPLNSRQVGQTVERYGNSGTPSMNADTERHKEDGSESQTDLQLVRKVRHGDRPAFDLLVVKYQSRVASIISRYVYDSQEVMDLTQETFVKAYRAIDRFRGDSAFYTWLYRIAVNTAKNFLESRGRRPQGSADAGKPRIMMTVQDSGTMHHRRNCCSVTSCRARSGWRYQTCRRSSDLRFCSGSTMG